MLDEPTSGLHPKGTESLVVALKKLRDQGNTVIVIEHDLDVIRSADHIIEMGPGAGEHGGQVVASGTYSDIVRTNSITAKFLQPNIVKAVSAFPLTGAWFSLRNGTLRNLKNVSVDVPLGA